MPRPLGPPPDERSNWDRLNEGQRRYAWEQYSLAKVRRGLPIDHPIPEADIQEPAEPNAEQAAIDDFDLSVFDTPEQGGNTQPPAVNIDLDEVLARPVNDPVLQDILLELNNMSGPAQPSSSGIAATPEKRPGDKPAPGPAAKRPKAAGSGKTSLPGSAQGMGGDATDIIEVIERPFYSSHAHVRHFKKVHRLISFGLAYKPVAVNRTGYSDVFMVTPMAHIPWEHLFMYLNPSEFELLPTGARAINMKCTVRAENVRIAFPTNSSDSNLATLNQNKFIRIGKGLCQSYQGVNAQPTTFVAGQPMICNGITEWPEANNTAYAKWVDNFYGVPNNDATAPDVFTTQTPRHQFGIPYVCQYYFMPVTQTNDPLNSGWEDFQTHLEEIKVDGPAGEICTMEYQPKNGLLKGPLRSIYTGIPSTNTPGDARDTYINSGAGNNQPQQFTVSITNNAPSKVTERNTTSEATWGVPGNLTLNQLVEKSQKYATGLRPDYAAVSCPTLHVGVMPVPALTTSAIDNETNNNSFTDAQAYYEVTCEMDVGCAYPTRRPLVTQPNVHMGAETWKTSYGDHNEYAKTMIYGLFQ